MDKRSKLDDKAKQCIFLGYGDEEFGYGLWAPVKKKLFEVEMWYFLKIRPLRIVRGL